MKGKQTQAPWKLKNHNSSNEVCSRHSEINIAGRLKQFSSTWKNITSDTYILEAIKNFKMKFVDMSRCNKFISAQECGIIDQEIVKLLSKRVLLESTHKDREFIYTIFVRPKKYGTYKEWSSI